jgi:hypothetical protein
VTDQERVAAEAIVTSWRPVGHRRRGPPARSSARRAKPATPVRTAAQPLGIDDEPAQTLDRWVVDVVGVVLLASKMP